MRLRPTRRRFIGLAGLFAAALRPRSPAAAEAGVKHVVLLGDSIFDNAAYVSGPDVVRQVRRALPGDWQATLLAVDGGTIASIPRQLQGVPAGASHLVVSVGGNDALGYSGVLEEGARSMAEALARLAAIREQFARDYAAMLDRVAAAGLPTAVCTIYDPRFDDPVRQRVGSTGLTIFNDAITRAAFARGLPLLDLRVMFSSAADYANAIEPSVQGGEKLAAAIAALVTQHDFTRRRSEVYAG